MFPNEEERQTRLTAGVILGAVVEDVKTVFERRNDVSIYIPILLPYRVIHYAHLL